MKKFLSLLFFSVLFFWSFFSYIPNGGYFLMAMAFLSAVGVCILIIDIIGSAVLGLYSLILKIIQSWKKRK